jgi:transposase
VGLITATALAASVPDASAFRSGRQFAAYPGLVPKQNSSGGKDRLGGISKMGKGYRPAPECGSIVRSSLPASVE